MSLDPEIVDKKNCSYMTSISLLLFLLLPTITIKIPGEGLGSSGSGISDPIMAGNVKMNNLGVGANNPGEVTAEDDIYEQYKKRMMLGYRYRPNPLVGRPIPFCSYLCNAA